MIIRHSLYSLSIISIGSTAAFAQLTWDPDLDQTNNGGAGTWDTTTSNWESGSANVSWTNGSNAVFGDAGANYTVDLDTGVTVTDLTYEGSNTLWLRSLVDNTALTLAGDATWDTGGGNIRFLNNTVNDTALDLAGNTLTVSGGGVFDAGEKGNNAPWGSGDLVFTEPTNLFGAAFNVGLLNSVTMAGGSFRMERNNNQDINNDWVLNGDVTFDNRWNGRTIWANGEISGTGRLTVQGLNTSANSGAGFLRLNNASNSWSGGLTVNGGINPTVVQIAGADNRLGAVPASFDADNIILRDGGVLKMNNLNMNANRGITLEGTGGVIVNQNNPNTINGAISGTGALSIGRVSDGSGNTTILASNASNYSGGTNIVRGTLQLGTNNALPSNTVVTIGGNSTSQLQMNGFDAVIGGLTITANNTRQIRNDGASASTLTFNVASGESYSYGANVVGTNTINIVKTGDGTQTISRTGGFTTSLGSIDVTGGTLVWSVTAAAHTGEVNVGPNGTLSGIGLISADANVAGTLSPGNSPGTITFNENLTLASTANLIMEIQSDSLYDVLLNDGGNTLTASGTLDLVLDGYTPVAGDSFLILENWDTYSGDFNTISGTNLGGGLFFDTSNLLTDGTIFVATPEPSSALLSIIGMMALLRRRR
ncbi:MAG: beta strand repeat-containing protein [Akkermansiaceae bacterium]